MPAGCWWPLQGVEDGFRLKAGWVKSNRVLCLRWIQGLKGGLKRVQQVEAGMGSKGQWASGAGLSGVKMSRR